MRLTVPGRAGGRPGGEHSIGLGRRSTAREAQQAQALGAAAASLLLNLVARGVRAAAPLAPLVAVRGCDPARPTARLTLHLGQSAELVRRELATATDAGATRQ